MSKQSPKQNIKTTINGETKMLQFDFCPKCSYFKSCYSGSVSPSYLSQECLDDYHNGVFDDAKAN